VTTTDIGSAIFPVSERERGCARGGRTMDAQLEAEITERVRRGDDADTIEATLLGGRPWVGEDERSALWLYAWVEGEKRRRFVSGYEDVGA
jgi:hypothetical protein